MKKCYNYFTFTLLTVAMTWSITTIFAGEQSIEQLCGAMTCDCEECGDTTQIIYECYHHLGSWPPAPGGSNPCRSDYCIVNSLYGAVCPELPNAGSCQSTLDYDSASVRQQVKDSPPSDCASPDYTEHDYERTDCRLMQGWQTICEISSCDGTVVLTDWRSPGRDICDL